MEPRGLSRSQLQERIGRQLRQLPEERLWELYDILAEWLRGDKRADERIACKIPVDYAVRKQLYRDFIQDLSRGGVFVETRNAFEKDQPVSLTFSLPDGETHFKIRGKVIRTEERGFAVRFEKELTPYQKELIRQELNRKG